MFLPVTGTQFRGSSDPIATVVLLAPNAEGRFIQVGIEVGGATIKNIPTWFAIGEIVVAAWVCLAIASVLVYAPFWLLGELSKQRRRPVERGIRVWPLLAALSGVPGCDRTARKR